MIHIDTSFLVSALAVGSQEETLLRTWLRGGDLLVMSVIAWGELLCGPLAPGHREALERIIPRRVAFDDRQAELAAELFNLGGRRRGSFSDAMIAASALVAAAPLATSNTADFERFAAAGLRLISPRG